jgi:hypothetical protein
MVAQSRRPVRGLTFACSLLAMLAGAQSAPAAADGSEGTQFGRTEPCIVGHRFEPGPIVGGHYRQPTQRNSKRGSGSYWHEAREVAAAALRRRSHLQPAPPTLRLIDPGGTSQNRNALVFGLKTVANF